MSEGLAEVPLGLPGQGPIEIIRQPARSPRLHRSSYLLAKQGKVAYSSSAESPHRWGSADGSIGLSALTGFNGMALELQLPELADKGVRMPANRA